MVQINTYWQDLWSSWWSCANCGFLSQLILQMFTVPGFDGKQKLLSILHCPLQLFLNHHAPPPPSTAKVRKDVLHHLLAPTEVGLELIKRWCLWQAFSTNWRESHTHQWVWVVKFVLNCKTFCHLSDVLKVVRLKVSVLLLWGKFYVSKLNIEITEAGVVWK